MLAAITSPVLSAATQPESIPSPPINQFHLGPLSIHFYALCILTGMAVAIFLTMRRYKARGGDPDITLDVALVAIPAGIIGARLYHVLTSWTPYFGPNGDPLEAFKIWHGGLGIWGGIVTAVIAAVIFLRAKGLKVGPFADAAAPGIVIAQGIGRLGNWFNQEVFGGPTTLPWGLEIEPQYLAQFNIPAGTLVHPTFLYELLWDFAIAAALLLIDKYCKVWGWQLFALYVAGYCFGRALLENVRVDTTDYVFGLRINFWAAVISCVIAIVMVFVLGKLRYPTRVEPTKACDEEEKKDKL